MEFIVGFGMGALSVGGVVVVTIIIMKSLKLLRDPAHDEKLSYRLSDCEQAILNLSMTMKQTTHIPRPTDKDPEEFGLEQEVGGLTSHDS